MDKLQRWYSDRRLSLRILTQVRYGVITSKNESGAAGNAPIALATVSVMLNQNTSSPGDITRRIVQDLRPHLC